MSRVAATYLNIPLAQLDRFAEVRSVFVRNTGVIIDQAMKFAPADAELANLADLLKRASEDLVKAYGDRPRFSIAKQEFIALARNLKTHWYCATAMPRCRKQRRCVA